MITVRIKNHPTLGNLQGPFELSIKNKWTWRMYSIELDRIVKYFGRDRHPDDVFHKDIANCKAYLMEHYGYTEKRAKWAMTPFSSFYEWMKDLGFAEANPVLNKKPTLNPEVQVIVEE